VRRRGRCGGPHGIGPGCAGRHVGNLGRRAMYLPPVLRPLAVAGPEPPAAQLLAEAAVSVVRGAPGSYAAERLADVVRGWGRWGDSVWLRLRDVRSTDLAGSLAAACQHRWSHADDGTGPTIVAADLRGTLDEGPDGGVVVIELGGRATPEVVELIGTIRPTVTRRRIRVIVVAESRWRPPVRHWPDCIVPACDLDDGGAVDRCAFPQVRARLRMYSGRLPAVVEDVLAAAGQSSPEVVAEALAPRTIRQTSGSPGKCRGMRAGVPAPGGKPVDGVRAPRPSGVLPPRGRPARSRG
jgi:hypothetical protein